MIQEERTRSVPLRASTERGRRWFASLGVLLILALAPSCDAPPERKGEISAWEWQREQERWQGASDAIEHRDPVSAAVGVLFGYLVGSAFDDDGDEDEER